MDANKRQRPVFLEVIVRAWYTVKYAVLDNLHGISSVILFVSPLACMWIGEYCAYRRGGVEIGGEWFIPFILVIIAFVLRGCANAIGSGSNVPIPYERFTEVDGDEVSVPIEREQEMILYVAAVEDYLERTGRM